MITKWSIENFKSFHNRTDLDFAPITLFAGANSSGKSSIIQSILLLKQTVQYAPFTRAIALNGPLLKLGGFDDVKNVASDKDFIGIGWEINLEHIENLFSRSNIYSRGTYPTAAFGRRSLTSVKGNFLWEIQSSTDKGTAGLPDALLQLQPKLTFSEIEALIQTKVAVETRFSSIVQSQPETQFRYSVKTLDESSRKELLKFKPDGQIIAVSARHFFPDRFAIQYDDAREKAFRVANVLCAGASIYSFRTPVTGSIIPFNVVNIFRQRLREATSVSLDRFALWKLEEETPVSVEQLSQAVSQANVLLEMMARTRSNRVKGKMDLIEIRDNIEQLMFENLVQDKDVDRNAIDVYPVRYLTEVSEYISAYFISLVRYLGPLRDEPKPIYPLEALINPTEVGYRGEHTAAVLDLHRDTTISYLPSTFV